MDWKLITEIASRKLGVAPEALKKWRQRRVPHKWRLPLIRASDGRLSIKDFDDEVADKAR